MIENKSNKQIVIIVIISLIIGFLIGFLVFSDSSFNFPSKEKSMLLKEVEILNKEIGSCIDQLNECRKDVDDELLD